MGCRCWVILNVLLFIKDPGFYSTHTFQISSHIVQANKNNNKRVVAVDDDERFMGLCADESFEEKIIIKKN